MPGQADQQVLAKSARVRLPPGPSAEERLVREMNLCQRQRVGARDPPWLSSVPMQRAGEGRSGETLFLSTRIRGVTGGG
jgi:hypothetical protein